MSNECLPFDGLSCDVPWRKIAVRLYDDGAPALSYGDAAAAVDDGQFCSDWNSWF